jgi:phenylacetic acid degradation operon negative regulatory protein
MTEEPGQAKPRQVSRETDRTRPRPSWGPGPPGRSGRSVRSALRTHAVGADTARRLLMTIMGEYLLPSGGRAWTSTFIDVMARLDVGAGTTRQALARTQAAGWLTSERAGRRSQWRLTPGGERLLVEGTKRIYEFTGPLADWDRRWLIVLASVPESDRAARHLIRTRLRWAGMGSPAPGVWVGPNTARRSEVEEALHSSGVVASAQVFVTEPSGGTSVEAMVGQAWDLTAIGEEYELFIARFSSPDAPDPLRALIELVHAWRRFPWRDPALPSQLVPSGWLGAEAATLFHDRHARWAPRATEEWERISGMSDRPPAEPPG